jgi:hypothetical protein
LSQSFCPQCCATLEYRPECPYCTPRISDGHAAVVRKGVRIFDAAPALLEALRAYVVAQSRLMDRWAEGDAAVRVELWNSLHACEAAGRAAIAAAEGGG